MKTSFRHGAWVTAAVLLGAGTAAFLAARLGPELTASVRARSLPIYGRLAPFELTDQQGRPVHSASMAGRVWVADFIFTRCAGQCPIMTRGMKSLQDGLGPEVGLVSFTSDPAFDTSEVLSGYALRYGALADRWLFLTGEKTAIDGVASGFHMGNIDEPMMHSIKYVLIDRQGQVRGYYDSNIPEEVRRLKRDASALSRSATGISA